MLGHKAASFARRHRVRAPLTGALRELGLIASDLLDEELGVLVADEDVEGVAERERRRERVIDYGVDAHVPKMTRARSQVETGPKDRSKERGPPERAFCRCRLGRSGGVLAAQNRPRNRLGDRF
jgi:hypothetical protein